MNTSRVAHSAAAQFGLFAIIESRRVVLPLKGVECDFSVRSGLAEVCMTQVFRQENPKPFDCEYLFPLPADAAVYSCEADINGRVIRAQIKERDEARKIVAEKKAEGFRTALVESERDNLFTLGLGNLQPDDLIIVRLKYFQTIRELEQTRSIEIPFCPGVRYIPGQSLLRSNQGKGVVDDTNQVPDASRITPVRIDAGHPDAAYIDVRGTLDAAFTHPGSLRSPSHTIDVQPAGEQSRVTLSNRGEVPDRDFVLRWDERGAEVVAPRAWLREKQSGAYALVEVRAPSHLAEQRTAIDFYFLVDRSGSMQGIKWSKAVEALRSCVAVLGPDDRAMVTLFETNFRDFAEGPLPVRQLLEDREFQRLETIGANGGTEMGPALSHVLEVARAKSAGRDRNLILITDAQIGNETAILDLMKSAPEMAVHCFGIDIALNDALLLALARQQGGTFHSLHPNDDIEEAVTRLGKTLRQPVLLDLKLSDGWECADARIPNLYAGQVAFLSARANTARALELTGRTISGETVRFDFQPQPLSEEMPFLQWCKTRIQRSLAEGLNREAIDLSVLSNLLCRLTAFVAWDDSEKVAVSWHELVQPVMEPLSKCFAGGNQYVGASQARAGARAPQELFELAPDEFLPLRASLLSRLPKWLGKQPEDNPAHDLLLACRSLSGTEWQPIYKVISDWFDQASDPERRQRTEALRLLTEKIKLCVQLLVALKNRGQTGNADLLKRLRVCQLQFRQMLQRNQAGANDLGDLDKLFRRLEGVDAPSSSEYVSAVAKDIEPQALEILKSFADSLTAPRFPLE